MTDRFTNMLRRKLTADWAKDEGLLDLRYHGPGIGGVHPSPPPQPIVEAMAKQQPRFIRIFLQEYFYIYPDHGVFDWSRMDAYMDAVHAMGGDIMASICIKPHVLYPVLDEKIWMPNDVAEWQEVIKAMVLRYSKEKPYVTHWAIANEQNLPGGGGCPYFIAKPDDYFEYYKITAAPIREALPNVKVGGPSNAGGGKWSADYLARFIELCKQEHVQVDFTCFNNYSDDPEGHVSGGRIVRDAIDKHDPHVKLYVTELNMGIGEDLSLEEKAYNPKRAAGLAATLLAFHEDGCIDGSFQYHIYDQMNDPREFSPWYAMHREMAEHWNDISHRLGLLDLDGKPRPQYFMYNMLYALTGQRAGLYGTDKVMRGLASKNDNGTLSLFLTNYAVQGTPDAVTQIQFKDAPAGIYRLHVYRLDAESAANMKVKPMDVLPPTESRIVYAHADFHFDIFTPADTVTLVQFVKAD